MKVEFSKHSIQRTIQRIKGVKNWKEAVEYMEDKFRRLVRWEVVWEKSWGKKIKPIIRNIKQDNWNYIIMNHRHRFVYTVSSDCIFKIVTYILYDINKTREYKKKETRNDMKRIEKLFNI